MLILLQIGALVLMYTILNDYLTYVYWITMAGSGVCNHSYYERTGDTGIQPDLDPADLDPAGIRLLVLCLCKTGDRLKNCRRAAYKNKAGYTVFDAESGSGGKYPHKQTGKCDYHLLNHQLQFPTYRNTKVTYFSIGQEKFAEMIHQLKHAKNLFFLEYFIVGEKKVL